MSYREKREGTEVSVLPKWPPWPNEAKTRNFSQVSHMVAGAHGFGSSFATLPGTLAVSWIRSGAVTL